ncbi:MAG: hypothetical protein AAF390_20375 [Pseudomonadota bacterium]
MNAGDTAIEVLLAWAVGLTIAGLVYGPIIAVSQGAGWAGVLDGITMIPTNLMLSFTIGAMISVPIMALGILLALLAGPRAGERPVFWTLVTAAGGTILFGLGDAVARGDLLGEGGWPIRPPAPVLIADLTIIALAVSGGALFYCRRLRARLPTMGGDRAER